MPILQSDSGRFSTRAYELFSHGLLAPMMGPGTGCVLQRKPPLFLGFFVLFGLVWLLVLVVVFVFQEGSIYVALTVLKLIIIIII